VTAKPETVVHVIHAPPSQLTYDVCNSELATSLFLMQHTTSITSYHVCWRNMSPLIVHSLYRTSL